MKVEGDKVYDDINITPMLDLAYVLLVMFIIMTTAAVQGMRVDLPKATQAQSLAKPKTKVVAVNDTGQIFLDAVPVSLSELEQQLRAAHAAIPDLPIIVKGDRLVQYEKVMSVIDVCTRIGISSIGLASQRLE